MYWGCASAPDSGRLSAAASPASSAGSAGAVSPRRPPPPPVPTKPPRHLRHDEDDDGENNHDAQHDQNDHGGISRQSYAGRGVLSSLSPLNFVLHSRSNNRISPDLFFELARTYYCLLYPSSLFSSLLLSLSPHPHPDSHGTVAGCVQAAS